MITDFELPKDLNDKQITKVTLYTDVPGYKIFLVPVYSEYLYRTLEDYLKIVEEFAGKEPFGILSEECKQKITKERKMMGT